MGAIESLVGCMLALDDHCTAQEFLHVYIRSPAGKRVRARKMSLPEIEAGITEAAEELAEILPDRFPFFRKTYALNLVESLRAQIEHQISERKTALRTTEIVRRLFSAAPPPAFDFDAEIESTRCALARLGYKGIVDFKRRRPRLRFGSRDKLAAFVKEKIRFFQSVAVERYGPLLGFDMKKLFARSKIAVVSSGFGSLPCYYRYLGNFRGEVGVRFRREIDEAWLSAFIWHEVVPGHHLYYLLKEEYARSGELDLLNTVDPLYSPETVVNEGLAQNTDLIFVGMVDDETLLAFNMTEKLAGKLLYNAWHRVHALGMGPSPVFERLLRSEFGMDARTAAARIDYFTREAGYYAPCYAIGNTLVERFLSRRGVESLRFLYPQQSAATLAKLDAALDAGGGGS